MSVAWEDASKVRTDFRFGLITSCSALVSWRDVALSKTRQNACRTLSRQAEWDVRAVVGLHKLAERLAHVGDHVILDDLLRHLAVAGVHQREMLEEEVFSLYIIISLRFMRYWDILTAALAFRARSETDAKPLRSIPKPNSPAPKPPRP